MTQTTTAGYTIPNLDEDLRKFRKLFLLIPAVTLAFSARGYYLRGMEGAYDLVSIGFGVGLLLTVFLLFAIAAIYGRKQKAVWARHTFEWYRATFPANAHAKGGVSCRHCGSEHIRAERMMNKTYMRTHTCGQCGKTLYFSPEQR